MRTTPTLFSFMILVAGLSAMIRGAGGQSSVPMIINYQGELRAADGSPLPDGSYDMIFRIYDAPTAGTLIWEETHLGTNANPVQVKDGILSVLLGSGLGDKLSHKLLDVPQPWLEIQVVNEILKPRQSIGSVAYAIRAEDARLLQGNAPSAFAAANHSHYGETWTYPSGTCLTLEGTARGLSSTAEGTTSAVFKVEGIYGYAENLGAGAAYGGYFATSKSGTGDHFGLGGYAVGDSSGAAYGLLSRARNEGEGEACGGTFAADSAGTGTHYGVKSMARAASSSDTFGTYSYGQNTGDGNVFGGRFETDGAGTGLHYGVHSRAVADSSTLACGMFAEATNNGEGVAYGLSVQAQAEGPGDAYGGVFDVSPHGTGRHVGVYSVCGASSVGSSAAVYGLAESTAAGFVSGGDFTSKATDTGTARCFGIVAHAYGNGGEPACGVYAWTQNKGTQPAYGGHFLVDRSGEGNHYGVYAESLGSSNTPTSGVYGKAENTGSGPAIGGAFQASEAGAGTHVGVDASAYGDAGEPAYGIQASASNAGSGDAYGGQFYVYDSGTGQKYAIYASAIGARSRAGWFAGNVIIDGDLEVTGVKNAVVETGGGQHRKLYCMESAEMWLEDFGTGTLDNGVAAVPIDPVFAQTINTEVPYHVFLTPEGDCNGLYVTAKTPASFEIRELQGGTSSIPFSYRMVGKRKGYEDVRLEKTDPPPQPEPPESLAAGVSAG